MSRFARKISYLTGLIQKHGIFGLVLKFVEKKTEKTDRYSRAHFKEFLADVRAYVFSIIKLLVIPIICALIVRGLPLDKMVSHVFVYEMAMPVGSMTLMLMKTDGENEIICSRSIVISTVLSIVTIPLISFFLT